MTRFFANSAGVLSSSMVALAMQPAYALDLEFFDGELSVEVSHQFNYGVSISTQEASKRYIYGITPVLNGHPYSFTAAQGQAKYDANGQANGGPPRVIRDSVIVGNGGRAGVPVLDDGRLAYGRGIYQNQFRGFSDIKANWGDFGARVRAMYFYDTDFVDQDREVHPGYLEEITTTDRVKRLLGRNLTTREAYVYWDGYIGDTPLTVRIGDQVLNWGGSQFAPGINQINPLDINNLLVPAFDPQNAREPIGLAMFNMAPFDWLNVEGYYQYDDAIIGAPPGGTFLSQADISGAGVQEFAGLGNLCVVTNSDQPYDSDPAISPFNAPGACVPLQKTRMASNSGQFGLNIGFQMPFLPVFGNYQFNAYYIRHHARIPNIGVWRAGVVPNAIPCTLSRPALVMSNDPDGRRFGEALSSATGGDPQDPSCYNIAQFDQTNWDPSDFVQVGFTFPEDQTVFGLSWRGPAPFGSVFSGEFAYRKDTPIQVSPVDILSAGTFVALSGNVTDANGMAVDFDPTGLSPATIAAIGAITGGGAQIKTSSSARESDDLSGNFINLPRRMSCLTYFGMDINRCNQQLQNGRTPAVDNDGYPGGFDGAFGLLQSTLGTPMEGWVERDVLQFTGSFLKLFPNVLGAERLISLLEVSFMHIKDMPTDLFMARTKVSCTYDLAGCLENADDFAWGYRLLMQANYDNWLGSKWQFQVRSIFFHDVHGYVPDNLLLFKEGRKNIVLDFQFKYAKFISNVRFLGFTGAKESNTLADRDTLQINFQYLM